MRRIPLINKDYAEHWSEEPRSIQYQDFLTKCRNSFSQDKNLFDPKERFRSPQGKQELVNEFIHQYKSAYIKKWKDIQRVFENCLRKNDPKRNNIVDCFADEMVCIDYFHSRTFYEERWEFFKICYEDSSNKLELTKIIPISEEEKKLAITKKHNKQIKWVNNWNEYQNEKLPNHEKMTKKEWLESECISESDFVSAERLIRRLDT